MKQIGSVNIPQEAFVQILKSSSKFLSNMTENKATRTQRKGAKEILRLGNKALAYRKDLLSPEESEQLENANANLNQVLKAKPIISSNLEDAAQKVDEALRNSGGLYYRKKTWVENVEMLLVAAIVVIGIRSFFVQPFIIPTNSMYPSFYGMQPRCTMKEKRSRT